MEMTVFVDKDIIQDYHKNVKNVNHLVLHVSLIIIIVQVVILTCMIL
jgi:hypothetical protein